MLPEGYQKRSFLRFDCAINVPTLVAEFDSIDSAVWENSYWGTVHCSVGMLLLRGGDRGDEFDFFSDHTADYKLKEMRVYADFVSKGNYMIAEDTCFDHYPAWPEYGPGPAKAVKEFVKENPHFAIDRKPEQHMISFAPMAFLRKVA